MPVGIERISQNVTDISAVDQLLSYATAGQLERLLEQRRDLTQGKIAQGAGLGANSRNAGAVLSAGLRGGLNPRQLQRLDEIIGALAPELVGAGGLSSLALRISMERLSPIKGSVQAAYIPPSWTRKILEDSPTDDVGVLIQASGLLSAFAATDRMDTAGMSIHSVRNRYGEDIKLLTQRLVLISAGPPTPRSYDAQILLGSLANYAFELMRDSLEAELRYSPLGFRVWRALTALVRHSEPSEHSESLRVWVRRLIRDSEELRKRSVYASTSLDLELAMTVPAAWSPPEDDWVADALLKRARNSEATIRERGTAVMGLWQRGVTEQRSDLEETEKALRELIVEFRNPATRPDAAPGLRWVAATLEHVIDERVAVCNTWPEIDEPWFLHVRQTANELDNLGIPDHLRAGTKNLLLHMILQNVEVYRRHAIETVVTGGWAEPVARALGFLLKRERNDSWLRVRAEFALGLLQRPDQSVASDLTEACLDAFSSLGLDQLADDMAPPRSRVSELHASLFAVGDCFGVEDAQKRAKSVREALRPVLAELATGNGIRQRILRRPARAAAYLLTVTAQPRDGDEKDLSQELLEKLIAHPDEVTARLSKWALNYRFAPNGTVRPLLTEAKYGMSNDTPFSIIPPEI